MCSSDLTTITTGPVKALNFVGTGNTFVYNSTTKTVDISISSGGNVSVSDTPPGISTTAGSLWWDSSAGDLKVYYNDGTSSQWVNASGGQALVQISETAPSSPQSGDLWWSSGSGNLFVYYNDGDSSQWISASANNTNYWVANNTGITTIGNVGIGTTNEIGRAHV